MSAVLPTPPSPSTTSLYKVNLRVIVVQEQVHRVFSEEQLTLYEFEISASSGISSQHLLLAFLIDLQIFKLHAEMPIKALAVLSSMLCDQKVGRP